jgi:hypothetical protein
LDTNLEEIEYGKQKASNGSFVSSLQSVLSGFKHGLKSKTVRKNSNSSNNSVEDQQKCATNTEGAVDGAAMIEHQTYLKNLLENHNRWKKANNMSTETRIIITEYVTATDQPVHNIVSSVVPKAYFESTKKAKPKRDSVWSLSSIKTAFSGRFIDRWRVWFHIGAVSA